MIGRETCQDYLKFWNVVDWLAIAFGITTVSLGKQDGFESWRPAPQPCDREPHFLDFPGELRQFCGVQNGSDSKEFGEFRQHAGGSDAFCYFIVWYFFKYKLLNLISQVVPGSVVFPRIVHHFALKSGRSFWMVFVLKVSGELPQTLAGLPSDALDFAVLNNRSYLTVEAVEGISTYDWDWLGWSLTSLVRTCKNILWACVFFCEFAYCSSFESLPGVWRYCWSLWALIEPFNLLILNRGGIVIIKMQDNV